MAESLAVEARTTNKQKAGNRELIALSSKQQVIKSKY